MATLAEIAGAAALGVWMYLTFGRGRFWQTKEVPLNKVSSAARSVVAVVPARNEAAVIQAAVTSLLGQHYDGALHIVMVDDNSSDGTAELATRAAQQAGAAGRFQIVSAPPPPPGWTGKLWAVAHGLRHAGKLQPDYFLLTDADISHAPDSASNLVAHAESGCYDLVSLMVSLRCETLAERAFVPAFVFFFFMLYPPAWIAASDRKTAAAAGGCILIRPSALDRIGGIAAIRGELIDDCALARRVKATSGRIWLGTTTTTRSLREYRSWRDIEQMISRTAFTQLHYSCALLAVTTLAMFLTFLAPLALLFSGYIPAGLGLASWLLMSFCFLPTLRLYRRSSLWAPLLPVMALFYLSATIHSALLHWAGRGGSWKGRIKER